MNEAAEPTTDEGRCPADVEGHRLLTLHGGADGGMIAAYSDGSLWYRPPGGAGAEWSRDEGPAWTTAPARDRTLALIKTGLARSQSLESAIGETALRILGCGLSVAKMKFVDFTPELAREFYREHIGRPYFGNLIESVAGPCVAIVLEGEGALGRWREMMGPSDPAKWEYWHLRKRYGSPQPGNIANNGFHGSDSPEAAEREIELLMPYLREGGGPAGAGTAGEAGHAG